MNLIAEKGWYLNFCLGRLGTRVFSSEFRSTVDTIIVTKPDACTSHTHSTPLYYFIVENACFFLGRLAPSKVINKNSFSLESDSNFLPGIFFLPPNNEFYKVFVRLVSQVRTSTIYLQFINRLDVKSGWYGSII